MTNHAGFAAEDAVTGAVPAAAQAGRHFSPFMAGRRGTDCKKAAAPPVHVDLAGAGVTIPGSWLDSMRASSPRHAKPVVGAEHDEWMEKHPSALAMFESIAAAAKGKEIVVFLDYDGTLSPIVADPDRAVMTDDMREAVRAVSKHFPTAIVSGRCIDKVFDFVKLEELYYAGSHGMDIRGPTAAASEYHHSMNANQQGGGGEDAVVTCQPAAEFLPVIDEVYQVLKGRMASIAGALVENNKFCLSVHYRCVDEAEWGALDAEVRAVMEGYPDLRLTKGRKVLEIRPVIDWDKGSALQFLLKSLGYKGRNDVFPIYIGDDRTDEDAFKVLRNMGQGIGILVTKFPKETTASYTLREPSEVKEFLRKLVKPTPKSNETKG
ncbi:probable trehalose-phosphate phosphatase 3 isoform X1 [Oryza brachyantha]|uniref:probable trehalose-phosphate phosphatase 3 isoform X1 n=1 Tax=Oryza brachyantha TaxID=4533 RepID=UPI001ADC6C44|nr:probable trehalose-phosphate phosphatase 3 isoform X1 [Oryza brachyantha]